MICKIDKCDGLLWWYDGQYFDHDNDRIYDVYQCNKCDVFYEYPERRELNE